MREICPPPALFSARKATRVITGFNTDIEYEGTVYHVQTEDKGLESPVILSLVYVGGAILASKRSPYDDLVVSGFDATALSERLNRQHKLICAAITAGRVEDLKRLSRNGDGAGAARKSSRKSAKSPPPPAADPVADSPAPVTESKAETKAAPEVSPVAADADARPAPEAAAISEQPAARAAAEAAAPTDAPVPANGGGATSAYETTQTRAESSNSDLPSWFETTAESFASILEKVAASEAAEAEAAKVEAEKAETAKVEAAKAEAAEAEQRRRFPPKDARVASGVPQPAGEFAAEAAPPAYAGAVAAESGSAREQDTTEIIPVEVEGELHVGLMEERDYKAGEIVTLRVRVARGPLDAREAVNDATVTVKILGTEFRPLILTSKTDRDGVAVVHAWLPRFTSGRAAILIRAAHDGFTAEMRRAVRHL